MPRLSDLLEWLAEAGNEHIWILLDVKVGRIPDMTCLCHGYLAWRQLIWAG